MSIAPIQSTSPSVLDLLSAKPASADARTDAKRSDPARGQKDGGFDQVLRESASNRPERNSEPVDDREVVGRAEAEPSREVEPGDPASHERSEKPGSETGRGESDNAQKQDESAKSQADTQASEGGEDEAAQGETLADAQAQATQAAVSLGVQQGLSQNADSQQAIDAKAQADATGAKQQAQAALQQAAAKAQAGPAQSQGTPTEAVVAPTAQAVQPQGTDADAEGGETRGETKASIHAAPSSATSGNTTAANAAFTLPDQPGSEARLQLNPTGSVQQTDAAKLVQAQPLASQGDNDAINTARLTRGLANAVQQRGGAVTLRLTPPEMGTVRIQMQITGANISASFHAESASAQTLLTQQLSQLRTSLESQGMNVERLSVQPMASTTQSQNANQNQNQNQNDGQQQNQAQQQSANDGRSRGQYAGDSSGDRPGGDGTPREQHQPRGFFDQLNDAAQPAA